MAHLSQQRAKKLHLHQGNYVDHYYRKNQMFLEERAPVHTELDIDVQHFTMKQQSDDTAATVEKIYQIVDRLETQMY